MAKFRDVTDKNQWFQGLVKECSSYLKGIDREGFDVCVLQALAKRALEDTRKGQEFLKVCTRKAAICYSIRSASPSLGLRCKLST